MAFSALTLLLVGRQEGHPACKKTEWWGAGVVICLERGADLHMTQRMPLPLTVSCFSIIQIGFTFLVPAHPGSPGQRAVKRAYVRVWEWPAAQGASTVPTVSAHALVVVPYDFRSPTLSMSSRTMPFHSFFGPTGAPYLPSATGLIV